MTGDFSTPQTSELLDSAGGTDRDRAVWNHHRRGTASRKAMWFTIVKRLTPGVRGRLLITLPDETYPAISEPECDRIFARAFAELRERGRA
jgi:hypothetical protein